MRYSLLSIYFMILFVLLSRCVPIHASEQPIGFSDSTTLLSHNSKSTYTPRELVLRIHQETSIDQLMEFSNQIGAEKVYPVFSLNTHAGHHHVLREFYILQFPKATKLEEKRQLCIDNTLIDSVEMNYLMRFCSEKTPSDPRYEEQWNLKVMNLPKVWSIQTGIPSVVVAVVDSGIEREHPELRNQLWQNAGEIPLNGIDDDGNGYIDDINGWDFSDAPTLPGIGDSVDRDNEPEDETGHGTHVSGIIAAEANNGVGIAGIAWNCRLMPLRAGFRVGLGSFLQNDDVAAAIVYAADNGANVINLSLGDTVNAFLIQAAVEYAYNRGCLLVAAAGNSPEPGAYYPAALNNVVSVASLDSTLQLGISNFGASIDIAAPGEDIISTDLGGYRIRSGTSMAAANVSGVSALLISANPSCANIQIQQWLTGTARRLSLTNLVGAGVVDAFGALTNQLDLTAQISALSDSSGTTPESNIDIIGSAGGKGFVQYWLEYGVTEIPDLWFRIVFPQTIPKYNEVLHSWDTSMLDKGIYTLRLSVMGEDGMTLREKVVVDIDHTLPVVSHHEAGVWFSGDGLDSTVIWQTDVLTSGTVEVFPNTVTKTSIIENPPLRIVNSDSVNRQHIVNLSELGLPSGEYLYQLIAKNRTGHKKINDNQGQLYPIYLTDERIQPSNLQQTASANQGMHAITSTKDFNQNGILELFAIETGTTGQSSPLLLEIDNDNFYMIASLEIPASRLWATADTDNDGLIEVLCNKSAYTFLLEQPEHGSTPFTKIWEVNGIWGGTIVDADLDGLSEIISRNDATNDIWVYEANGNNSFTLIAQLENPTKGKNKLATKFSSGDFDADGRIEIVAGDSDGDLFIYEGMAGNQYIQTWSGRHVDGIPQLFAAGDLDGDAIPEFAIGSKVWTTEFDLPRQHWLISIFSTDGNNSYKKVWHQRIRELRDGDSGITIADANNDGINELCIATSPNFYLVQYDGTTYRPIWYHPATDTFNPIVADLNNDSYNELLFNSDNVLRSFSSANIIDTTKRPPPPWNLDAKPYREKSIVLDWQATENSKSYILYRGESEDSLKPIAMNIQKKQYIDTGLNSGQTYWYAVQSQDTKGESSNLSEKISAVPSLPSTVLSAIHSPPRQLVIEFSNTMDNTAANPSRYQLHRIRKQESNIPHNREQSTIFNQEVLQKYTPQSAIFDRSRKRVVLTFIGNVFNSDSNYKIETLQLSDINGADIREDTRIIDVEISSNFYSEVIVYPNPARGNQLTIDRLPVGSSVRIFDVAGNLVKSFLPTHNPTNENSCRRIWILDNISNGVYIYVLETETGQQVGQVSIIR